MPMGPTHTPWTHKSRIPCQVGFRNLTSITRFQGYLLFPEEISKIGHFESISQNSLKFVERKESGD